VSEESDSDSDREEHEGIWGVDSVEDRGELSHLYRYVCNLTVKRLPWS